MSEKNDAKGLRYSRKHARPGLLGPDNEILKEEDRE
jgi:hypothetical protein